ncbi:MAG: hypothetical protein HC800_21995 [Phormidesmis sp. RL_2_1]|nr:hypothetical protein [Phormidesmis sp. RL_2_1]
MTQLTEENPTIYLAGDMGASASKFFYRVHTGQTVPIWMTSAISTNLTNNALPTLSMSRRPQDSAWLQIDDEIVLVSSINGRHPNA